MIFKHITSRRNDFPERITRRRTLQTLGGVVAVGLTGCLGDSDDSSTAGGNGSPGTAEISFLGESYRFEDASCEGSRTFPPENEQIHYRNYDEQFEFWVERFDPEHSETVEVFLKFPHSSSQTIGEVEGYKGQTTIAAVEFELGSHTRGTVHLDPGSDMNDDVAHDPDGGTVEWDISC